MVTRRKRPAPNASLAVAYLRASTEDQLLGRDGEREDIAKWAAANGVTVVSWHVDQGVSGGDAIGDRPALIEAIASLKATSAARLIVKDRTRLARDVMVAATIDHTVEGLGAHVVSADGVGNGTSPADGFVRTVMDAAAAMHRATIKANTKQALASKRAKGERVGTLPYGSRLAVDGVHLEVDPSEQAVIERARALRASALTIRAVAEELELEGFVNRRGGPFSAPAVHAMLRG